MSRSKNGIAVPAKRLLAARISGLLVGGGLTLLTAPAGAALLDHGPADPTLGWPSWYRDTQNPAVVAGLCKSQTASPNPLAAGGTMCFPIVADPAGFAGNIGEEAFYNNITKVVNNGPTFAMTYVGALEATYGTALHPTRGDEVVFARTRLRIDTTCVGDWNIVHPLGTETPTVTNPGIRAINITADFPVPAPGDFNTVLGGQIGPFIQWDVLNPGETLSVVNSAGQIEQFLGDPNYEHTFKGGPFNRNAITVTGPVGCNVDGAGNNTAIFTTANVVGQKWTTPIPTAVAVTRAVFGRTATGANRADIEARSITGQTMIVSGGAGMPSLQMVEERTAAGNGTGRYFAHLEWTGAQPPANVNITNLTSVPPITVGALLGDVLQVKQAQFDVLTGQVAVRASTSDEFSNPTVTIVGINGAPASPVATNAACGVAPFGPPVAPGDRCYSTFIANNFATPSVITAQSTQGGQDIDNVITIGNNPMNPTPAPTAADDTPLVAGLGATAINVLANDTTLGAAVTSVLIVTPPTKGTVTVGAAPAFNVSFTPAPGASGQDNFTYLFRTATGVSNQATVSFNIPFVPPAPTVNPDEYGVRNGVARVLNVLANDVATQGQAINAASVQIATAPTRGTAVVNANGTITYTSNAANTAGLVDTFTYTVANTSGTRSLPATVKIVNFTAAETLSVARADYTRAKNLWTINGTTTWASTSLLAQTVTCYNGAAINASQLIGSGPISTAGAWTITPLATAPVIPSTQLSGVVTCQSSHLGTGQRAILFK